MARGLNFPNGVALSEDGQTGFVVETGSYSLSRFTPGVLRRVVWALPDAVRPQPARQIWVVAVDPNSGAVVHDLQGEHPHFGMTTGVREHEGTVWLGSLVGTTVAAFRLAPTTARQS